MVNGVGVIWGGGGSYGNVVNGVGVIWGGGGALW